VETDPNEARVPDDAPTAPSGRRRSGARRSAQAGENGSTNEERGNVGQQIYAEVNRIIDAEGISKQDAFKRVGEAQGRQTGTVAANYYRVARSEGSDRGASRSRRPPARPGGRGRRRTGSDTGAAITALRGALDELGRAIREQDREIARLQEENAQFGELRTLIARTGGATRGSRRTRR
jgi:hypothetical protein